MLMEIFDVTLFYVPFDGNVLEGGNCVKNRIRYKMDLVQVVLGHFAYRYKFLVLFDNNCSDF